MDGIFINYRRDDSAPYAGRLYDHLRRSFPGQKVFMDIDAHYCPVKSRTNSTG